MDVMMKCGCASMVTHKNPHDGLVANHPSCFTHEVCIVVPNPNLDGRTAKCFYFGSRKPKRAFANDECNYGCQGKDFCECEKIPSKVGLAFFESQPNMLNDKFYCGCSGWD